MFSDLIKSALDQEVVGQPRAVNSVVRGVTRVASGLVPPEGLACAYLFMGPTGTGKTHLVRTLARILHGSESRLVIVDCSHFSQGDPWSGLVAQLTPLFTVPRMDSHWTVFETQPMSIILVEYLERGPDEVIKALAAAMETGHLTLPGGRTGSLNNCLLFITSSLCSRQILDEGTPIGFSGAGDEEDEDSRLKIFKICSAAAQDRFGTDLLGRLDNLIVFRRLEREQLSGILDRLEQRLNEWLQPRGFQCELRDSARQFLLERGCRNPHLGSRELLRAYRRFVEFPMADLMISQRIPTGRLIRVDRQPRAKQLQFSADTAAPIMIPRTVASVPREVPVRWAQRSPE